MRSTRSRAAASKKARPVQDQRHERGPSVLARNVFIASDVMALITTFQHGLPADVLALLDLPAPLIYVGTSCRMDLFHKGDAGDIEAHDTTLAPWLKQHIFARIPRLFEHLPHMRRSLLFHSIHAANQPLLQYLHDTFDICSFHGNFVDIAAHANNLEVVRFLVDHGHRGFTCKAMDAAARHGNLVMAELLDQEQCGPCSIEGLTDSTGNGHSSGLLDTLDKMLFNLDQTIQCPPDVFVNVAANEHLDMVQWQCANRTEAFPYHAIDGAASNEHLVILEHLKQHRRKEFRLTRDTVGGSCIIPKRPQGEKQWGQKQFAMDKAAKSGHLEVVKSIYERRGGCSHHAIDYAAKLGRLDICEWLFAHTKGGYTTFAVDWAAENNHWRWSNDSCRWRNQMPGMGHLGPQTQSKTIAI
ncbi:Aste57867_18515 [Aphanomyces stellatus]|uniref:Aste57867_18515 protein n=1 Tax=Aphanomyces stellatus TaxID=120398 RepID=A0A485LAA9_9STRA|nr:hypothetical protein As57867_018453 [Aphanomyces stellatus]VFT95251.1 Aste57867_18515 [Aphanomyces stellatus]